MESARAITNDTPPVNLNPGVGGSPVTAECPWLLMAQNPKPNANTADAIMNTT